MARKLASRLGFTFLDTGALYRAVAFLALDRGIAPDDEAAVDALVADHPPEVVIDLADPQACRVRIGGRVLDQELFTLPVSQAVSPIAAMAKVRRRLIGAQRAFAVDRSVVMAGRDIGTVVLPDARYKFFLTASIDARVDRRLRELHAQAIDIDREQLRAEILGRDARDTNRPVSPLVRASDAVEIDTSAMSIDEVVERLERAVRAQTLH